MNETLEPTYPPAFCPVHKLVPATAFAIRPGNFQLSLEGNRQDCPIVDCDETVEVISGVYSSRAKGALEVLLHPDISAEAREALISLAKNLQSGNITPTAAQEEAEKITEKAKGLFDISGMSDGPRAAVLAAIISASGLIGATGLTAYSTLRSSEKVAEATIEAANISAKASPLNSTSRTAPTQTHPRPTQTPEARPKKDLKGPR